MRSNVTNVVWTKLDHERIACTRFRQNFSGSLEGDAIRVKSKMATGGHTGWQSGTTFVQIQLGHKRTTPTKLLRDSNTVSQREVSVFKMTTVWPSVDGE